MKNLSNNRYAVAFGCGLASIFLPLHAADVIKDNNAFAFNTGDSWVDGDAPGAGDRAVFDETFAAAHKPALTGDVHWYGIRTADAVQNIVIAQAGATAGNLTLGGGGIVGNAVSRSLSLVPNVLLSADQTWSIPDSTAAVDLTVSPSSRSVAGFLDLGGKVLLRDGGGRVNIAGGSAANYEVRNGLMVLGAGITEIRSGTSSLYSTTVKPDFSVLVNSGSRFITTRSSSVADNFVWQGQVTLHGGTWEVSGGNNAVTLGGGLVVNGTGTLAFTLGTGTGTAVHNVAANLSGGGVLSVVASAVSGTQRVALTGDNSGFSGTVSLDAVAGNRTLRLAGDKAGGVQAKWHIGAGNTLEIQGANVTLGDVSGVGALSVNNGRLLLNGAGSTFAGQTTVIQGTLGGTGNLAGLIALGSGGRLEPGNSVGTFLHRGSLDIAGNGSMVIEIGSAANYDMVTLLSETAANYAFNGALMLELADGYQPVEGDRFDLVDWNSNYVVSGAPEYVLPALNAGLMWDTREFMTQGVVAVVPEPSGLLLAVAGCGGLLVLRRRG